MKRAEMVERLRRATDLIDRLTGNGRSGPPLLHEARLEVMHVANALDAGVVEFDQLTGRSAAKSASGLRDGAPAWLRKFAADIREGIHRHQDDDADCLEALASRVDGQHV